MAVELLASVASQDVVKKCSPVPKQRLEVKPRHLMRRFLAFAFVTSLASAALASAPFEISGIYPHLAMFNLERECGTGAVVPWADRLWVVTYAPHSPRGSTDKLY
jgi:hypothetical protein